MFESTLLGGLLGGLFRFAPEVLRFFDRGGERKHELAMQDRELEFAKLRGTQRMAEINAEANSAWDAGAIGALKEAITAQGQRSGVKWVDALSTSVRPVITYLFMLLYMAAKITAFTAALNSGALWSVAVAHAWTEADQTLWAGILNFFFLGRIWDRNK